MSSRSTWASQIGFILASVGAAVGLGAIWKFPYLAGSNGGSAFFFPYMILTFTVGLVLLIAEIAIGRIAGTSTVPGFRKLGGKAYLPVAYIAVATGFGILCFYSAVGGWTIAYFIDALLGNAAIADKAALGAHFGSLVADPMKAIGFQMVFLLLTALVVNREVSSGIERLNKVLLPTFFILMIVIIVRGVTLPGAEKGIEYLFSWHPEAFTWQSLLAAMGFMFFSLCVGCGVIFTYGSYLKEGAPVIKNSAWVLILSLLSSIMGGLMIMPAVFAFGLDPAGGPDLTFITMPIVFSKLPFGNAFAAMFYLCLVFAALTSAVSILEMCVAHCVDELHANRVKSTVALTFLLMVIGSLCALSFGLLKDVKIFGRTFFDNFDFLTSNLGMPIGGLVICALAGVTTWKTVQSDLGLTGALAQAFRFVLTIASPIVIITVLVTGLL